MLELAAPIIAAIDTGRRLAVSTVIEVDGSAPRALGTSMAVDDDGHVIGSISGGCVEGAVYDACSRVLESGIPEVCAFGFSDADAFAVGLACGGRISVFVQELGPAGARNSVDGALRNELERSARGEAAGVALVLAPSVLSSAPPSAGGVGDIPGDALVESTDAAAVRIVPAHTSGPAPREVVAALAGGIRSGRSSARDIDCEGVRSRTVLLVSAPPPRLILFGAVDFSVALANAAVLLGYRVTVCDARPVFATPERFPQADVVNRWPADYLAETEVDERTVVCILTHDDKFDLPLIETALSLPVAYVGAMGSRRTHQRRVAALRERGLADDALAALHSPIGLDLGASSPEETAVSILAEVLATKTGASGLPLEQLDGPIHRAESRSVRRS
jgi:xanthine dehydrogenase accessory factor